MNKFIADHLKESEVFSSQTSKHLKSSHTSTSERNNRSHSKKKYISIYSEKKTTDVKKESKLSLLESLFCSKSKMEKEK